MESSLKPRKRDRFSTLFKRQKNTPPNQDPIASTISPAQPGSPQKSSKIPLPLDVVKKYSPVFQFHLVDRCFLCSIEHPLHNSVLHYRNFAWPTQIGQSSSSTPALASFRGWLYVAYQDSNG